MTTDDDPVYNLSSGRQPVLVSTTPVTVLVKIPYDLLKRCEGSLAHALETTLSPFEGSKFSRWELGASRMYLNFENQGGWGPSDNEFAPIDVIDDLYPGAAYYQDVKELMEPTWAVLDEKGVWHEASNARERGDFLTDYEKNFLRPTASDTVIAVVLCWS